MYYEQPDPIINNKDGPTFEYSLRPEDKDVTLRFFMRYPRLVQVLDNIHTGMKDEKYDFPLVICGGTGNGKSMLLLHIIELWIRVIQGRKISFQDIKYVQNTRDGWINNFKKIESLDINANDEGTNSLMSKESMHNFNITLNKLYNVFRKKLYFTIILIPDYFELPLWFRKRIRGCILVDKRGRWRYYTKTDLSYANSYNENKPLKTLYRAHPTYKGYFPDYVGVLRDPYNQMANDSTKEILDELIMDNKLKKTSVVDMHYDEISTMIKQNVTHKEIAEKLHTSPRIVGEVRKRMRLKGDL